MPGAQSIATAVSSTGRSTKYLEDDRRTLARGELLQCLAHGESVGEVWRFDGRRPVRDPLLERASTQR